VLMELCGGRGAFPEDGDVSDVRDPPKRRASEWRARRYLDVRDGGGRRVGNRKTADSVSCRLSGNFPVGIQQGRGRVVGVDALRCAPRRSALRGVEFGKVARYNRNPCNRVSPLVLGVGMIGAKQ